MSKNTRGVIHLFIPLIIVVILVVIGFFIYRQTKQSSTTTTSPSTTADLTKNWVRHTTDKYLISFKYPPSLSIKETKSEDVEDSTVSKNIEMAFETVYFYSADNPETPLYTLGVYNPTNAELTPYGYYQEYLYLKGPCDLRWLDSDPFRAEQFHANGHAVLKIEIFEPAEHFSCYYVKDVDSNIIVLSTRNLKDAVEHGKINLQAKAILGTLQIEPYYLDKNHNWRLYKHQSFPLSFKYPQSWDLLNVLESTNRIVVNLSSEDLEKESGYFGGDWPTTYYYGGAKILVSIDKKTVYETFEDLYQLVYEDEKSKIVNHNGIKYLIITKSDGFTREAHTILNLESLEKPAHLEITITGFPEDVEKYYQTFDQILSTFEFIEN